MLKDTLVIIDLDGTLLKNDKTISNETLTYLKSLQDKGVKICLASGRPYRAVLPYYNQIGLNTLIVCYNGAMVIDPKQNDKILYQVNYPLELVFDIVDKFGKQSFLNIMVETFKDVYFEKDVPSLQTYTYKNGINVHYGDITKLTNKHILGALFEIKNGELSKDILKFVGSISEDVNIRFWANTNIAEFYFNQINKYTSIQQVAKIYNLKNENIICIGDAQNDMEMIYKAGIGVAMKNSDSPIVKHTADMVSLDTNNNDGVRKTLQLLLHDNSNL